MQGRAGRTASKARAAWPEHVGRGFPGGRRCLCIPQGMCLALCPHQPPRRALLLPPGCYKDVGVRPPLGCSCPPACSTATPRSWWLHPRFAARRGDTRSRVWDRGCQRLSWHWVPPPHSSCPWVGLGRRVQDQPPAPAAASLGQAPSPHVHRRCLLAVSRSPSHSSLTAELARG